MSGSRTPEIPLVLVGCDFRNAAVSFRELLVTTPEIRAWLYKGINSAAPGSGLAVLETCNRIEWIASTDAPEWVAGLLSAQMLQRWREGLPAAEAYPEPYVFTGRRAAKHILRVVAGLESLVPGEAQIAGQFQDALQRARDEGTASDILNGLTNPAGRLAKSGYRMGFRADHHRGIHGMTADYVAAELNGAASEHCVAVVGMGNIGRKTAEALEHLARVKVLRVNRTVRPEHAGVWRPLHELPQIAAEVDAIVVATGGLTPVIQPEHIPPRERELLVVDIGIPRQVSPRVAQQPGVDYRDLDALAGLYGHASGSRSSAEVEEVVERELARYRRFCIERNIVALLEESQRRRQEFIQRQIPHLVETELGGLDPRERRQVEAVMKQLIGDFSADSFNAIHEALEKYWSSR